MAYDTFLYQAALLVLGAALFYTGLCFKKLAAVAGKSEKIWLLPAAGAVLLAAAAGIHALAVFSLMPQLGAAIGGLSADEIIMNPEKLEEAKIIIESLKSGLVAMKALSFTLFFAAAGLLAAAAAVYMRWISE